MKKRVVVALGHQALGTDFPEQKKRIFASVKILADLVEEGCQLIITHSNAPQVGMIHTALNEYAKTHETYNAPMAICSSMSQGYIGYDIQNMLRTELMSRGIYRTVSTIITQVVVDPYDDAFYHPIKVIGRYLNAEEAAAEEKKGNYVVEEPGKGFRRIVASPKPLDIVEIDAINALVNADQIVIAGGGLPLEHISAAEAREHIDNKEFGEAGMLPKVEACVNFVSQKEGRQAIITNIGHALDALHGKTGTIIS